MAVFAEKPCRGSGNPVLVEHVWLREDYNLGFFDLVIYRFIHFSMRFSLFRISSERISNASSQSTERSEGSVLDIPIDESDLEAVHRLGVVETLTEAEREGILNDDSDDEEDFSSNLPTFKETPVAAPSVDFDALLGRVNKAVSFIATIRKDLPDTP